MGAKRTKSSQPCLVVRLGLGAPVLVDAGWCCLVAMHCWCLARQPPQSQANLTSYGLSLSLAPSNSLAKRASHVHLRRSLSATHNLATLFVSCARAEGGTLSFWCRYLIVWPSATPIRPKPILPCFSLSKPKTRSTMVKQVGIVYHHPKPGPIYPHKLLNAFP